MLLRLNGARNRFTCRIIEHIMCGFNKILPKRGLSYAIPRYDASEP